MNDRFTCLLFHINPFLRLGYFKLWPWKIHCQGHGWGQRSRSHSWSSIQAMHFLLVSCQTEQPFLNKWPMECLTLGKKSEINPPPPQVSFRNPPKFKFNQVISRGILTATKFCSDWMSGSHFIGQTRKFFVNQCHNCDLGSRSQTGHPGPVFYLSLRPVLDSNNLLLFLAETIWFSVAVLATRSKTAAKSAHLVTCSCVSTFWDNWTSVTKVRHVTWRKIWK